MIGHALMGRRAAAWIGVVAAALTAADAPAATAPEAAKASPATVPAAKDATRPAEFRVLIDRGEWLAVEARLAGLTKPHHAAVPPDREAAELLLLWSEVLLDLGLDEPEDLAKRVWKWFHKADGEAARTTLAALEVLAEREDEVDKRQNFDLLHAAAAAAKREHGVDDRQAARVMRKLGDVYAGRGRWAEADRACKDALAALLRTTGDADADLEVALTRNSLGWVLALQGKHAEAEPLLRQAVAGARKALPDDHPRHAALAGDLAVTAGHAGKYDEAVTLFAEALRRKAAAHGEDSAAVGAVLGDLGLMHLAAGKPGEAEDPLTKAVALARKHHGDGSVIYAERSDKLGDVLRAVGRPADAEPHIREAQRILRLKRGPTSPVAAGIAAKLVLCLLEQRKFEAADLPSRESLDAMKAAYGEEHANTLSAMEYRAVVLLRTGKRDEGLKVLEKVKAIRAKAADPMRPGAGG